MKNKSAIIITFIVGICLISGFIFYLSQPINMEIEGLPENVVQGHFFDIGLKLKISYRNGKSSEIYIDRNMVENSDNLDIPGEQNSLLKYGNMEIPFIVNILEDKLYICGEYEYHLLDGNSAYITGYHGGMIAEIPNNLDGKTILKIGEYAFKDSNVCAVQFPDSVYELCDYAFADCVNIEYMYIPATIKKAGSSVWAGKNGQSMLNCIQFGGDDLDFSFTLFNYTPFTMLNIIAVPDTILYEKLSQPFTIGNNEVVRLNVNCEYNSDTDIEKRTQNKDAMLTTQNEQKERLLYIDTLNKKMQVNNSEQLLYALRLGFSPVAENEAMQLLIDKIRNSIYCVTDSNMNLYQKIAAFYDYICDSVTYDEKLLSAEVNDALHHAFMAEGVFMDGIAICDGYAKAFEIMCRFDGIEAIRVTGDVMQNNKTIGHAWNKVKLDGKWYNVDCTFGDTIVKDEYDYTNHYYLLCSDNRLQNRDEHTITYECDTDFDIYNSQLYSSKCAHEIKNQSDLNNIIKEYKSQLLEGNSLEIMVTMEIGIEKPFLLSLREAFLLAGITQDMPIITLGIENNCLIYAIGKNL